MPAHVGSVLMSGNRKAIRASQMKRAKEIERINRELEGLERQHDSDPDDRKRRKLWCIPLPLNGCCLFSLRGCVLTTAWIIVVLPSLSLIMLGLKAAGWYQDVDPFQEPLFFYTDVVSYVFMTDSIIQIIIGFLLIIGVTKESSKLQLPYLVMILVCNVATLTAIIVDWKYSSLEVIAQRFVGIAAHIFMWVHVLSYYFITKEHEDRTTMLER